MVLFVVGRVGIIRFGLNLDADWNWQDVATVEEQYRPSNDYTSCLKGERADNTSGAFYAANARIEPDGTVSINPGNYAYTNISGQLVYFIG